MYHQDSTSTSFWAFHRRWGRWCIRPRRFGGHGAGGVSFDEAQNLYDPYATYAAPFTKTIIDELFSLSSTHAVFFLLIPRPRCPTLVFWIHVPLSHFLPGSWRSSRLSRRFGLSVGLWLGIRLSFATYSAAQKAAWGQSVIYGPWCFLHVRSRTKAILLLHCQSPNATPLAYCSAKDPRSLQLTSTFRLLSLPRKDQLLP